MAIKVEIYDDTQSIFVQFNDGTTLDWGPWDRQGPNRHLKDGDTDHYDDGCTVTRVGARELTYDPNLVRPQGKAKK